MKVRPDTKAAPLKTFSNQEGGQVISHIVTIETQVRDAIAVAAACGRLGLTAAEYKTVKLFSGEATGLAIELPGWRYPVVAKCETGELAYDNFEGRWGEQKELDRFMQAYAVEKCRLEARRRGHTITEQPLQDGSIKVTVQVAGGAA